MEFKLIISLFSLAVWTSACNNEPVPPQEEPLFMDSVTYYFKERFLCNCVALGMDSSQSNAAVQKIRIGNQVYVHAFDPIISKILKPVMDSIYYDSVFKSKHVAENAHGKDVIKYCLQYYHSKHLDSVFDAESIPWRKYKTLREFEEPFIFQ